MQLLCKLKAVMLLQPEIQIGVASLFHTLYTHRGKEGLSAHVSFMDMNLIKIPRGGG